MPPNETFLLLLFLRTMDAVGVESRFKAMPMPKRAPNPKATAAKQAAKAKPSPPVAPNAVEVPEVPKPKAPATRVRSKGGK